MGLNLFVIFGGGVLSPMNHVRLFPLGSELENTKLPNKTGIMWWTVERKLIAWSTDAVGVLFQSVIQ